MGEEYDGDCRATVHAFVLESLILNFAFLGIVELPDLDLEGILQLWPQARDAEEHDALAALPLQRELLELCLDSHRLPQQIFSDLLTSNAFDSLADDDHKWHPTSLTRIAMALWIAELDERAPDHVGG